MRYRSRVALTVSANLAVSQQRPAKVDDLGSRADLNRIKGVNHAVTELEDFHPSTD